MHKLLCYDFPITRRLGNSSIVKLLGAEAGSPALCCCNCTRLCRNWTVVLSWRRRPRRMVVTRTSGYVAKQESRAESRLSARRETADDLLTHPNKFLEHCRTCRNILAFQPRRCVCKVDVHRYVLEDLSAESFNLLCC